MAIIHGGLSRISLKYPGIDIKNTKIIAWGAGQYFRDLYPLTEIKAEYTICPIPENHGKIIHGIEVKSPDFLKSENPENVVILIFSGASNQIAHQIADIGNFMSVPAIHYGKTSSHIIDELLLLQKNLQHSPSKKEYFSEIGFFTQGPIFDFTELALAYHRYQYPNDYHCFVTDAGQSPEKLSRCARWVDDVIEVPHPETPGLYFRNYMIRTARVGAELVRKKGMKYSVRVRSGNVTIGDVRKFIYKSFGHHGNYNLNKIGFHMGWSWKNVPFHISDAFMVGRSEDIVRLWQVAEDQRSENDPGLQISAEMHHLELARVSNESYIWSDYARKSGLPHSTIEDHLKFMRDHLIPLEPDLSTHPLKYTPLFELDFEGGIGPTKEWWRDLVNNYDYAMHKALEISKLNISIAGHFSNKVG